MNNIKLLLTFLFCLAFIGADAQRKNKHRKERPINKDGVSFEVSEAQGKGLSEGNLGVIGTTDDGLGLFLWVVELICLSINTKIRVLRR